MGANEAAKVILYKGGSKERTVDIRDRNMIPDVWQLLEQLKDEKKITGEQFDQLWEQHVIATSLQRYIVKSLKQ